LVKRTVEICERNNRPVASWKQAREILGLRAV
jgi:3-keto-5-aminohexanoate cleavage enzyme